MKLTSMKRTKKEREGEGKNICTAPYSDEYGYGLCIRLDKNDLAKLGLKPSSFDVGDEIEIEARGTIKALRQDKSNNFDSASVEIQLEELGVEAGSAGAAISKGISDADDE